MSHVVRHSFAPAQGVPPKVGPFAHATTFGDLVLVTGQMPTDPRTGLLVGGGIVEQTRQVLRNLDAVLTCIGLTFAHVLMVRAYLVDFDRFDEFNAEYQRWFAPDLPSRTCVGVNALAAGALVEIDLTVGRARSST